MKFKSILLTALATLGFTAATMAQVPNYVPTNGLMGWWPFNGNSNNELGNGNNGSLFGATLTNDRFGNANKAYVFNGTNYILLPNSPVITFSSYSISIWFNSSNNYCADWNTLLRSGNNSNCSWFGFAINRQNNGNTFGFNDYGNNTFSYVSNKPCSNYLPNNWYNLIYTRNGNVVKEYLNGYLINQSNTNVYNPATNCPIFIGSNHLGGNGLPLNGFTGKIDDIGIWDRELTPCEVTDLYNSQLGSFSNSSISINPSFSSIGSMVTLSVSTSLQSVQWQSNPSNIGWVNLSNNANYNGVTNDTLIVSNLQISNHNQPFRVLACGVNSNITSIQIADTCITSVTLYDTLLTTVTDTLVINATITGINPPNNLNTLKVFPNPASTHITIDYGNFNAMSGYTLTIINSVGQTVFTTPINQQASYIDLSTWTGNGIYFVQLIDPQNNTIVNRKIVIQ